MSSMAVFEHVLLLCIKIFLKIVLRLLNVNKDDDRENLQQGSMWNSLRKPDDHCSGIETTEKCDSLKQRHHCFSQNRNEALRKCERGYMSSCDESSDSEDICFSAPGNAMTPRNRKCPLQSAARTSSPVHVLNRQYSSSSGVSSLSDVINSELDTRDTFSEYYDSLDSMTTGKIATETENAKLKIALCELTKEKMELQNKFIQQHELMMKYLDDFPKKDSMVCFSNGGIFGTAGLVLSTTNISMQEYQTQVFNMLRKSGYCSVTCQKCPLEEFCSRRNFSVEAEVNSDLNTGNQSAPNIFEQYRCQKCSLGEFCSRRHFSVEAVVNSDVNTGNQSTPKPDIQNKGECESIEDVQKKVMLLEKENCSLKEYINGLLFMILENSPSLLEAKKQNIFFK